MKKIPKQKQKQTVFPGVKAPASQNVLVLHSKNKHKATDMAFVHQVK